MNSFTIDLDIDQLRLVLQALYITAADMYGANYDQQADEFIHLADSFLEEFKRG